ncbi:LPS export ABC transporter periplasmic protein LptC [Halocynthiibacter styelae]|uniref:LPS export ABC transporter periplasmic protein LptC n=1 Tax=Halocynthiibacter styelae TaxID=2761955 RepID=A0A8J7IEP0_9RHOB|nr:LPS export ABC transporter periplasmic protein LptC [Paenihalocynthiibacter styelae]MBI1493857.1 LPS export ABC transporter periplasmic protein LptC [Paenihalocynthiibacter styelae]
MNNVYTYSRFIAWVKVILPLAALALLSTLFLFSRGSGTGGAIPFSEREIEERAQTPRVTRPNFTGVTGNGTALSVQAETATPDPEDAGRLAAEGLQASIDTPGGTRFEIVSDSGQMNNADQMFSLSGDVRIESSEGMQMSTSEIETALDGSILTAPGAVSVTGRFGSFDADSMLLELAEPDSNTYVLVFKGGVKLVYTPVN